MIKQINLANFQSHKDTTLTLDQGLNVIVGPSDSGKSSIIRALRWLIWNRPMGDAFRSHWGGTTSVEVVLPERNSIEPGAHKDQTTLMRLKSDKHNQYLVNGTDNLYKAFKNDVPEQVQEILNMDEVNLQRQGDNFFLISSSPGEVAAYFNKIASLDQIDKATANIQKQIRTITDQIAADESTLQNNEVQLVEYEYIDKFEIELEQLEKDVSTRNYLDTAWHILSGLLIDISNYEEQIAQYEALTDLEPQIDVILDMYTKQEKLRQEGKDIISLISDIDRVEDQMITERRELVDMEEAFHQYMPEICPLCGSEVQTKNEQI